MVRKLNVGYLWPQPITVISLHCNQTTSRDFSKIYNERSRHISPQHEYVRKLFRDGVITIVYTMSCNNLADPIMKGLSRDLTESTSAGIRLRQFD